MDIYKIEQERTQLESKAKGLIDAGKISQADALKPKIDLARSKAWKARGQLLAHEGGDLWQAAAWALTGGDVKLRWHQPEKEAVGTARSEPGKVPVVDIFPYMADATIYDVFLHEIGHVVDHQAHEPGACTKEERERRADELAGRWKAFAENHCDKYDRAGRSGLQMRLLSLLDYPG